ERNVTGVQTCALPISGAAAGAALQIEFDQQGSINGTAAVRIATDAAEASYSLYWLNPDSLTIQSAGSGRIASGHAEILVRMGGRSEERRGGTEEKARL